jgi:hypothetical protein
MVDPGLDAAVSGAASTDSDAASAMEVVVVEAVA